LQIHKVKPETLKSILSLVRNSDNRPSAIDTNSNRETTRAVGGDKSAQQCVTSHTGNDDVTADDVSGEVDGEAVVDSMDQSQRSTTSEACDATTQDEQMRLASEGEMPVFSVIFNCDFY